MEHLMKNNNVYLCGKIVEEPRYTHNVYGEGFYETALSVERLSDQCDVIPLTVSDRLLQDSTFEVGNIVCVTGQFRSYNKMTEGKSKLMLTVFVRDILEYDPEKNPNQIELTGYICKEPIYRVTPFRREIADVLVAVNRAYNKSDYIPCISWGRNARFASGLSVGTKISLTGRIQSREYQKVLSSGEAETRVAYEISVNRISLAEEDEAL